MKNNMNIPRLPKAALAAAALLAAFTGSASEQTVINWKSDAATTAWETDTNWTGETAPANDLTGNIAGFNFATYTNQPTAPANRSIAGIELGASSGPVTISTATGNGRLRIGASGITMADGAGELSWGGIQHGVNLYDSQKWINNSGSLLSMNTIGSSGGPHTLTLEGSGAGGFQQGNSGWNWNGDLVVDYAGAGEVVLHTGGTNRNWSGNTTIKQGTLSAPNAGKIGIGNVTLGHVGGMGNVTLNFTGSTTSGNDAPTPIVLATGHTGEIRLAALSNVANNRIGAIITGGVTGTNNLILDVVQASATVTSMRFDSGINITGNVTKRGVGSVSFSAANTFGGIALVEEGNLRLDHVNALQNATLDTGTVGTQFVSFIIAGDNTYNIGGLQGSNALAIGGNTISVGANNANTTFSGAISGANGALTKVGSGALTLDATNTYTGATTVSGGTLVISSIGSIASSAGFVVGTSGTLDVTANGLTVGSGKFVGGDGTINGDLTLASGALFAFDPNSTLTLGGDFALDSTFGVASLRNSSGGAIDWSLIGNDTYTLISGASLPTFSTSNITNFGSGNAFDIGDGRSAYFENGSLALVVIPEPGTLVLVGMMGLALLAGLRRRK